MRNAVIGLGGVLLLWAGPAEAKKIKPGKATDAQLLEQLTQAQAPDQQLMLDEIEKRGLATACPQLGERARLDDAAGTRGRSLAVMDSLDCPNLLDTAVHQVEKDRFPANRLAALDVVRAKGSAEQVPLLLTVLGEDQAVQVRHRALGMAIETGWEGTDPLLVKALRDDYTPIVQDAAVVLLEAGITEGRSALYEEIPTLQPEERASVMQVWETRPMPGDTGYLLSSLSDSHTPVAVSAANALGALGDASVVAVLQQKLAAEKDKDLKKALKAAIKALGG